MAAEKITDKNTLKSWFKRGLKPLEAQFHAWMDSFWHKSESIPTAFIDGLEITLNNKVESRDMDELKNDYTQHKTDVASHPDLRKHLMEHTDNYFIHKTARDILGELGDDDIPETIARIAEVDEKLKTKVDNVEGKNLSTEDYTTFEQTKLANIDAYITGVGNFTQPLGNVAKVGIEISEYHPGSGRQEAHEIFFPEAGKDTNGLLSAADYLLLQDLKSDRGIVDVTGTPSNTWHIGKPSGIIVKNSEGTIEFRNSADNAYASLMLQDLTVTGNMVIEGDSFIVHSQTVETADNIVLLNKGEVGNGVTKGVAGIEIDRGTAANYKIVFDESDDRFKAGVDGDLWPILLRDNENFLSGNVMLVWDATNKRAKTRNIVDADIPSTIARVSQLPVIPSLDGGASATDGEYVSGVTVSGHTIAVTKALLPSSLPASDVYPWAKAATKPSYSYSEISGTPSLAGFATQGWVQSQGYLTFVPAQSWNNITDKPNFGSASSHQESDFVNVGFSQIIHGQKTFESFVICNAGAGLASSSDMRFKNHVQKLGSMLEFVLNAPSILYNWKDEQEKVLGTSAQYWEKVVPELVKELDDDSHTKLFFYDRHSIVLQKALQEEHEMRDKERKECLEIIQLLRDEICNLKESIRKI